jgi:hypothetical protein
MLLCLRKVSRRHPAHVCWISVTARISNIDARRMFALAASQANLPSRKPNWKSVLDAAKTRARNSNALGSAPIG